MTPEQKQRLAEIKERDKQQREWLNTPKSDRRFLLTLLDQAQRDTERVQIPAGLDRATKNLVLKFAEALAEKLFKAEQKYGYSNGWLDDDWESQCQSKLLQHVAKGDPRDVAAYCAFMWHHGWKTSHALDQAALARGEGEK